MRSDPMRSARRFLRSSGSSRIREWPDLLVERRQFSLMSQTLRLLAIEIPTTSLLPRLCLMLPCLKSTLGCRGLVFSCQRYFLTNPIVVPRLLRSVRCRWCNSRKTDSQLSVLSVDLRSVQCGAVLIGLLVMAETPLKYKKTYELCYLSYRNCHCP